MRFFVFLGIRDSLFEGKSNEIEPIVKFAAGVGSSFSTLPSFTKY